MPACSSAWAYQRPEFSPMRSDFARAAASYDEVAVLAQEIGRRMAERLDYVRLEPARVADIGCATGDGIHEMRRRYPRALPLAIDFALPMLEVARGRSTWMERLRGRTVHALNADVNKLPLATNALGLAWSNLLLHWLPDPLPAFRELHRVIEVGGLLTFSLLGPDTLKEIRHAAEALGMESPVRRFHDMHDIGDMLVAAGFADPVMDMEMITLTYDSPRGLLRDQRLLGVRAGMFAHWPWRDWRRLLRQYALQRSDGRLPASFEVVYGHAWKAPARVTADGRTIVQIQRHKP
jgi:malonyl-CoA O-methyltransferase